MICVLNFNVYNKFVLYTVHYFINYAKVFHILGGCKKKNFKVCPPSNSLLRPPLIGCYVYSYPFPYSSINVRILFHMFLVRILFHMFLVDLFLTRWVIGCYVYSYCSVEPNRSVTVNQTPPKMGRGEGEKESKRRRGRSSKRSPSPSSTSSTSHSPEPRSRSSSKRSRRHRRHHKSSSRGDDRRRHRRRHLSGSDSDDSDRVEEAQQIVRDILCEFGCNFFPGFFWYIIRFFPTSYAKVIAVLPFFKLFLQKKWKFEFLNFTE